MSYFYFCGKKIYVRQQEAQDPLGGISKRNLSQQWQHHLSFSSPPSSSFVTPLQNSYYSFSDTPTLLQPCVPVSLLFPQPSSFEFTLKIFMFGLLIKAYSINAMHYQAHITALKGQSFFIYQAGIIIIFPSAFWRTSRFHTLSTPLFALILKRSLCHYLKLKKWKLDDNFTSLKQTISS